MLLTTVLLAATAWQGKIDMSGYQRRRVFEATRAARKWAMEKSWSLYPTSVVSNETAPERRGFLYREAEACRRALRIAALNQVCEDYKMTPRAVQAIMNDEARVMLFPHNPEKPPPPGVDARKPGLWMLEATLFSPEKVRLTPRLAKRFGYKNPRRDGKDEFNRRAASQDLKDQLLDSSGLKSSPPIGANK